MRYFVEAAYSGTAYVGWQSQPNGVSVQEVLEKNLSIFLRDEISIMGCGRTDAGVHAASYFFHFDTKDEVDKDLVYRLNKMLPKDIGLKRIIAVGAEQHARFDAVQRKYIYHIHGVKDPFANGHSWYHQRYHKLDFNKLKDCAELLLQYAEFFPFCKSNSDATHYKCDLQEAYWKIDEDRSKLEFHIAANRFLRGMVRLIVGMCTNVAGGQITLNEVKKALDHQDHLKKSLSAPPEGLFLVHISYPFIDHQS